jgi:hypothetical protein
MIEGLVVRRGKLSHLGRPLGDVSRAELGVCSETRRRRKEESGISKDWMAGYMARWPCEVKGTYWREKRETEALDNTRVDNRASPCGQWELVMSFDLEKQCDEHSVF